MNETVALAVGLLGGLLIIGFVFWPAVRILRRLQLNPAWLALAIIPLALLVLLWCLAYAKWPGNKQGMIMLGPHIEFWGILGTNPNLPRRGISVDTSFLSGGGKVKTDRSEAQHMESAR